MGVQHDEGEGYQQPIKESKSELPSGNKIEYLYPIPDTYNLVLNGAWHCSNVGLVLILTYLYWSFHFYYLEVFGKIGDKARFCDNLLEGRCFVIDQI